VGAEKVERCLADGWHESNPTGGLQYRIPNCIDFYFCWV